ncbi:hypothetical protein BDA99DRAFT_434260 [Phascolomyces articulosus]|uniref:HSF-type DNA-binding domain-containing protein n=1 Tax=Phascolomyces articulosus TaxID=60185 RepID=A0AAD5KLG7_9FUNG|nr:hypothetical protein BDA99DRAFT_434260 [Phascolomyces articulosus]
MSSSSPQPSSSDNSSTTSATSIPQRIFVQRNVPAFLNKLYSMVNDPSTDNLIHWSKDGNSFIVEGHEQFAKSVLPRFYKHNTFASFVRQLNMYDFHKIPHLQQGVLISDSKHERWEFSNPNFQRGRPEMLVLVTRKRNRERGTDDEEISLASLVKDIAAIRKHQISISNELHTIQQDNAVLWEDTLTAREKHQRHQEVIGKILQFLTIVFSNNDRLPSTATSAFQQQLGDSIQNISKHSQLSSSFTGIGLMEEHSSSNKNDRLVIRSRQKNDSNNSIHKNDDHDNMKCKGIIFNL